MAGRQGQDLTAGPVIPSDGSTHAWSFHYDPRAGDGDGQVVVTLDDQTCTLPIPPALRKGNATFDRFGFLSWNRGGNCLDIYLDDVEYTAR